jgi:hypothetical protein
MDESKGKLDEYGKVAIYLMVNKNIKSQTGNKGKKIKVQKTENSIRRKSNTSQVEITKTED